MILQFLCWAQSEVITHIDQSDHYVSNLAQTHDHKIAFIDLAVDSVNGSLKYTSTIVTADPQLNFVKGDTIPSIYPGKDLALQWLYSKASGFVVFGFLFDQATGSSDIVIALMDSNFSIISDTIIFFPNSRDNICKVIPVPDGYGVLCYQYRPGQTYIGLHLIKLTTSLQILDTLTIYDTQDGNEDLTYNATMQKIFILHNGGFKLGIVDYASFKIDTILINFPYSIFEWFPGSSIQSLGSSGLYQTLSRVIDRPGPQQDGWKMARLIRDTLGNISNAVVMQTNLDTTEIVPRDAVLILSSDTIISCAVKSWEYDNWGSFPTLGQPWVHSWVSIYSHSLCGAVHWNLTFGGDLYYETKCTYRWSDGSFFSLGSTHTPYSFRIKFGWFLVHFTNSGQLLGYNSYKNNSYPIFLYPNPSEDWVTLDWRNSETNNSISSIRVYNLSGKLVFKYEGKGLSSPFTLNTSSFIAGPYLVSVSNEYGKSWTLKLIVK
jgi:hypothetical protein